MLEEYHKDSKVKAQKCQIEKEKLRREANKQKIMQLKAEKAQRQKTRGTTRLSLKKRRREIAGKMQSRIRLSRKQTENTEAMTESTRGTQKRPKKRQKTPKITILQDAQTQTRTDKEQEILGRGHRKKKRKRRD